MGELFVISDEFQKKLHPKALEVFNNWSVDILNQTKVEEFSPDDLEFLSAADIIKLKRIYEVSECLNKCVDIKDGDKLYDVYFGDIFLSKGVISQLKRDLLNIEFDIVPPLKKIYEGRVAKAKEEERKRVEEEKHKEEEAREEQRKQEEEERQQTEKAKEEQKRREEAAEAERRQKEEEERWRAARGAVNPPINDAKRYLDRLGEYDEFIQATLEAIEVYLKEGEDYLHNSGTFDYRRCLWKINYRKEEERQKIAANFAANEYNRRLDKEKVRLKALLFSTEKNTASYFKNHIKDARYTGESFSQFLDSEEIGAFDKKIEDTGRSRLAKLVNNDFQEFFYAKYYRSYFLLPSADYSLEGVVPCLNFVYKVFVVVEIRVWFKPGRKQFGGYSFNLPWREEKSYSVLSKDAEFLGYDYFLLNPEELDGYSFWQSIPLVLLKWLLSGGLLSGQAEPPGITVSAVSDDLTTYKISKFEGEVDMPDNFANYLKNIGSIEKMLSKGIVNEKVASTIRSMLGEQVEQEASPQKDKIERKDTGKSKAFRLFDEGKRPSDREVKALKIKSQILYRYYQEWKKVIRQ